MTETSPYRASLRTPDVGAFDPAVLGVIQPFSDQGRRFKVRVLSGRFVQYRDTGQSDLEVLAEGDGWLVVRTFAGYEPDSETALVAGTWVG